MIGKYAPNTLLTHKDKEFIFEAFRAPFDERGRAISDNDSVSDLSSATLDKRMVMLNKLEKLRNNTRTSKVKALISLEEDDADNARKKRSQG